MKITETRKAIIELIEPYMDKNIDCGIVIKLNNDYITVKHEPIKSSIIIGGYKADYGYDNVIIIGHYDITALEKYIMSLGFVIITYTNHKEISNYGFNDGFGTFPNKPLHLFTEQENKDLKTILLNLK